MPKLYYRILLSSWKTFGFGFTFLGWLFLLPLLWGFTHFTLFLDNVFFNHYRKVQIKQPVFILGNPRSGTSFLHLLLTQTREFSAFEMWHLFVPSLTARAFLKPIVDYLVRSQWCTILPEESGHGLYLNKVEHDEFLFIHRLDTQFVNLLSPLAFDEQEYPELRLYDQQPEFRRKRSINFFRGCLQRQVYYTGKEQVIAHVHFSTHRIKTLLETFPDAKFIYLVRSPHETVPSHLSLEYNTIDHLWGVKNIPPGKLRRYYMRRYRYDIDLYRYFYTLQNSQEIPEDRVMVLRYDLLRSKLKEAFEKIVTFTGIEVSENLRKEVQYQAQIQKAYKRKHKLMRIEEFGLTQEQISKDFSFVFEAYDLENNPVVQATA